MRGATAFLVALALAAPLATAATEQQRSASFPMAAGFEDRMTIISGAMELSAPASTGSAGFFRVSGVELRGLTRACWQPVAEVAPQCAEGPIRLAVSAGSSFGFSSQRPYQVDVVADHALATFVDLAAADGFGDHLNVGPSVIASLVGGTVEVSRAPILSSIDQGGLTVLEPGGSVRVLGPAGTSLHVARFDDAPLILEGTPVFARTFRAEVVDVPFGTGASVRFSPAAADAAATGVSEQKLDLLDTILHNVRVVGPAAKVVPLAILARAGGILSEVFNGAFLRTRLADDPKGLGDVAFAKFTDLRVKDGTGRSLDFEGSYTLVVGDLGPSFDDSEVSNESQQLRWWVGTFVFLAAVAVGAWLWFREGPVQAPEPGPQTIVARIATAIGVVIAFFVWDWQLDAVLGSSILTTDASGAALGVLVLVQLASLALAGLLIGVPAYLVARYGIALAKQPRYASLAATAAVFLTIAFGILLMPALVSMLVSLVP